MQGRNILMATVGEWGRICLRLGSLCISAGEMTVTENDYFRQRKKSNLFIQ